MARLKKEDDTKRTAHLPRTRCTPYERGVIEERAAQAGLSLSDYMRQMALSGHVIVREPMADNRLIYALLGIGRNLNQLTKKVHIFGEYDMALMRSVLRKIDGLLDKLL